MARVQIEAKEHHEVITIAAIAPFVHGDESVGITIKGQTKIGTEAHHGRLEIFGVRRAAVGIDVAAIGSVVNHVHSGTERRK